MPRAKAPLGPSRLSQVLKNLNRHPKPVLPSLKTLKLTLAARNDHFGARHFIKEDLPRIQYTNPGMQIQIDKIPRSVGDTWRAEMLLEFKNGSRTTMDVSDKWSTSIFEELMARAGGDRWQAYVAERRVAGQEPDIPSTQPHSTPKEGIAAALP
ncbi:hypothetical protein A7U60_g3585 [Sanghuangporus baumii]|uniref:Ribosomal protein/NADH dehydrogenase domain-containing protein n=1 Tax=Sanghuangporus baumii TaxID=108892 RepID=A0A9Q5I0E4_SANBA|nr:hypothetical protein A7U60_g3585 [Sanghuangporus baumii]